MEGVVKRVLGVGGVGGWRMGGWHENFLRSSARGLLWVAWVNAGMIRVGLLVIGGGFDVRVIVLGMVRYSGTGSSRRWLRP